MSEFLAHIAARIVTVEDVVYVISAGGSGNRPLINPVKSAVSGTVRGTVITPFAAGFAVVAASGGTVAGRCRLNATRQAFNRALQFFGGNFRRHRFKTLHSALAGRRHTVVQAFALLTVSSIGLNGFRHQGVWLRKIAQGLFHSVTGLWRMRTGCASTP
jgi:hypothetical protein